MSHVPTNDTGGGGSKTPHGRERPCVFRVLRVSGTMRKAEEEAIRRARREIVRVRGLEEAGVLGDLIGGTTAGASVGVDQGNSVKSRGPLEELGVIDESEDEGMLIGDDED